MFDRVATYRCADGTGVGVGVGVGTGVGLGAGVGVGEGMAELGLLLQAERPMVKTVRIEICAMPAA